MKIQGYPFNQSQTPNSAAAPSPVLGSLNLADGQFQVVASHPPGTPIVALGPSNEVLGLGFRLGSMTGPGSLREAPALRQFANTLSANSDKGTSIATFLSTTAEAIPPHIHGLGEGLREAGDVGTMVFCAAKALSAAEWHDKAEVAVCGLRACIGAADLAAALGDFHGLGTTIHVLKIVTDGLGVFREVTSKPGVGGVVVGYSSQKRPNAT